MDSAGQCDEVGLQTTESLSHLFQGTVDAAQWHKPHCRALFQTAQREFKLRPALPPMWRWSDVSETHRFLDRRKVRDFVSANLKESHDTFIGDSRVYWLLMEIRRQLVDESDDTLRAILRSTILQLVPRVRSWTAIEILCVDIWGADIWERRAAEHACAVPAQVDLSMPPPPPPPPVITTVAIHKPVVRESVGSHTRIGDFTVPKVLLFLVMMKMPIRSLLASAQVCRFWKEVSEDDVLWLRFLRPSSDGTSVFQNLKQLHSSFGLSARIAKRKCRSQFGPVLGYIGSHRRCDACNLAPEVTAEDIDGWKFLFRLRPGGGRVYVCPRCVVRGSGKCRCGTAFIIDYDFVELMIECSSHRAVCENCMRTNNLSFI